MSRKELGKRKRYELGGLGGVVEIGGEEMIGMVMHFLQEQGLEMTAKALCEESGIRPKPTALKKTKLESDIKDERWAEVLSALNEMQLKKETEEAIRKLVATDLRKKGYIDLAQRVSSDSANHTTKERAIQRILDEEEAMSLEVLVGQALKWQVHCLGKKASLGKPSHSVEDVLPAKTSAGTIRLGLGSRVCAAQFLASADHDAIIIGSSDGLIEIYDPNTCRLRLDLAYQANDEYMAHEASIADDAFALSLDASMLASAAIDHTLKLWHISHGKCLRKWRLPTHITSMTFCFDLLAVASKTDLLLLGLHSGAQLLSFQHNATLSALTFLTDANLIATTDTNGTLSLWSPQGISSKAIHSIDLSLPCLNLLQYRPKKKNSQASLLFIPKSNPPTLAIEITHSPHTGAQTSLISRAIHSNTSLHSKSKFIAAATSPFHSSWLYCISTDSRLFAFNLHASASSQSNKQEGLTPHILHLADYASSPPLDKTSSLRQQQQQPTPRKENAHSNTSRHLTGLAVHPQRNLVATFGDSDVLRLWK